MNILKRFFNRSPSSIRFQMIEDRGNGFYSWDGKLYKSDIVRACIRPKIKAIGKLIPEHIRNNKQEGFAINPEPYIRFLLEDPNPYMSGQVFFEKMTMQLALNNNAFAVLVRDENGYPTEMYNVPCVSAEAIYDNKGLLYIKFTNKNGKIVTFPYTDIIHIRQDFNDNDIFGESPRESLLPLMNVISTTDQGIIKAVKNSGVIRWLLKYNSSLRPEDLRKNVKQFTEDFLSTENEGGAAGVDSKAEAQQIDPKDYVPNAAQMDRTTQRIYSFFNTNEKIVQSNFNEDEWNAYYESEIEPVVMKLSNAYTNRLFSDGQQKFNNKIVFESASLQYASMSTKLNLAQMVDRGAMTPNEWREVLNLAPIEGGDKPLRRLDTAVVGKGKEDVNGNEKN